jgi:DNA polymerase-1
VTAGATSASIRERFDNPVRHPVGSGGAAARLMPESLYIIDGHAQIYRAFYAPFRELTSPTGEPTRATFVFCSMLLNLLRQKRPDYIAMAMDVSDETVFRRDIDAQYKAHRDPAPEALHVQADRIVSIVEALGIPILRVPGFEADDVMATVAERLRNENVDVYLVSRDKDLEQLISDRVRLYDPTKDEVLDARIVEETKGYAPKQAVEVQTLAGDSTDNIPGVAGVGVKTAAKLIRQYGTADAVVAHADELSPKLAAGVKAFAAQLPLTRQLVTLRKDTPIEFELSQCRADRLRFGAVRPIFRSLGFTRLTEALDAFAPSGGLFPGVAGTPDPTTAEGVEPDGFAGRRPDSPKAGTGEEDRSASGRGHYVLVDTSSAFQAFVAELGQQAIFSFDTETTGLHPVSSDIVGFSAAWRAGEAYYVPVRSQFGQVIPRDEFVQGLRPIFANSSIRKVGQNLKFDILVFRQLGIETAGVHFDTMLASFLLEPVGRSHSLDALAKSLLGHDMIPITDLIGRGKNQRRMDEVDTREVCEYAAEDADFAWRLYEILEPRMAGSNVERLFRETEMPLVEVLAEMENNGIRLDEKRLAKLGDVMADRMLALTKQIHQAAGHPFNIDSTRQLATVLFEEKGLPVVRKTKTGVSTDAETLEALAEQSENPIPRLVLEYRELAKLKGTYVDTLPKMIGPRTGRVHATFHQTGAVTGRLSSSDPNLQNIPIRSDLGRQIRSAFVAGTEETVLMTADYSQVELRVLAHLCKDEGLVDAFRRGLDIHRAVAAEVHGIPIDAVTGAQRSAAKAVNFGIIYGQTPFGLSRTLGIPTTEAKEFIDRYFERYPGIRAFIDRCIEEARRTGYAETILGRRRPIPELSSRNRGQVAFGERIAVNTVVQGSAADLIKRAMVDIHRELKRTASPARMLIQVHDELVFEVPAREVGSFGAMVREKMSGALSFDVPIVVDIAWGRTWTDAKD